MCVLFYVFVRFLFVVSIVFSVPFSLSSLFVYSSSSYFSSFLWFSLFLRLALRWELSKYVGMNWWLNVCGSLYEYAYESTCVCRCVHGFNVCVNFSPKSTNFRTKDFHHSTFASFHLHMHVTAVPLQCIRWERHTHTHWMLCVVCRLSFSLSFMQIEKASSSLSSVKSSSGKMDFDGKTSIVWQDNCDCFRFYIHSFIHSCGFLSVCDW